MARNTLRPSSPDRRRPLLEVLRRDPATPAADRPPLLFVHGLGHGAWCWEHWLDAAAAAGHPAVAVSLRGHAGSAGSLRGATLGAYVDDVVRVAATLPRQAVLVGHSLGGLVVQRALARYAARAAVLVAPVPARPAVGSLGAVARRHPTDAVRMVLGASLPLRADYLFHRLPEPEATRLVLRCGPESTVAQYQLLFHRPSPAPRGNPPVLVLAAPNDRLVPFRDVTATARRYGAEVLRYPGMGHDLMLDAGWERPAAQMLAWLRQQEPSR